MFKLKNRYGNINYVVNSESERDELLSRGFLLVEETPKQKTEGKKNGKENKAKTP